MGLVRSHYVGRTFIEPQQSIRHFGVRLKLNPISDTLRGKRVVVVDDSIVRGTTSRKIVKMLRDAGAREVHMRISSPPTAWPCYYGIDTPTRSELIASSSSVEEIRRFIEADTLAYLSREGMYTYFNGQSRGFVMLASAAIIPSTLKTKDIPASSTFRSRESIAPSQHDQGNRDADNRGVEPVSAMLGCYRNGTKIHRSVRPYELILRRIRGNLRLSTTR
jgi:hypothetical protein